MKETSRKPFAYGRPRWIWLAWFGFSCLLTFGGCVQRSLSYLDDSAPSPACVDNDGDGFGRHCSGGADCDDANPAIHLGCSCTRVREGCACEPGQAPVACFPAPTQDEQGQLMCHEGTRYCRDGIWGACEGVVSYLANFSANLAALLNPDAGTVTCSACDPNCFLVEDPLDPVEGGLADVTNGCVAWADGGGITLPPIEDGGTVDCGSPDPPSEDAGPDADAAQDAGTDAAEDAGPQPCVVTACQQSHVYECGDCEDNDGDGLLDMEDPDCLGPCHNREDSYSGGIPGQNNAPCKHDCYFDKDTGHGNDDCEWHHGCDPKEPQDGCEYVSAEQQFPSMSATCSELQVSQSQQCLDECLPLTPHGCDCFGCCELPAGSGNFVWIGSEILKQAGSKPESGNTCSNYSHGEHEYYVCNTANTRAQAKAKCQGGDMELAVITTLQEAQAVAWFIADKLGVWGAPWIGATNTDPAGVWKWDVLDRQFWAGGSGGSSVDDFYENWVPGHPQLGGRDCVRALGLGFWFSDNCGDVETGYVCEEIGGPTCDRFSEENSDRCRPCTPLTDICYVECGHCDLCIGKTTLPPDCEPPPDEPTFSQYGIYTQVIGSPGCLANERPDWQDLYFEASMPEGTSIEFSACTMNSASEVCTPTSVGKVTASGSCAADTDCAGGYCGPNGVCQFITAGSCDEDGDCGDGATCVDSTCTYSGQPVDVAPALIGCGNYIPFLRVDIALFANPAATAVPVLYSWHLDYVCTTVE